MERYTLTVTIDFITDMRFTIRNNTLVSLSCGTPVKMETTLSVLGGGFSFAGADGLAISGILNSTTTSYGQVNAPGCGDGRWCGEGGADAVLTRDLCRICRSSPTLTTRNAFDCDVSRATKSMMDAWRGRRSTNRADGGG